MRVLSAAVKGCIYQVLETNDAMNTKQFFNEIVIRDWKFFAIFLNEASLANEVVDNCFSWISESDIVLDD